MRQTLLLTLALLAACAAGCSGRKAVYPVKGQVVDAKGRPAAGAVVVLHPRDGAAEKPVGRADEAGEFRLTTYAEYDGAPSGDYAVTVIWPTPRRTPLDPEGGDQLKGKLAKPELSKLSFTVEKKPDNQVPPIKLP